MNELDIIRNHFLGFHNDFFDGFKRVSTYPPYNIKEKDDLGVIEFAVAGFAEKDLKVEVKEQTLHVSGCKEEKTPEELSPELKVYETEDVQEAPAEEKDEEKKEKGE